MVFLRLGASGTAPGPLCFSGPYSNTFNQSAMGSLCYLVNLIVPSYTISFCYYLLKVQGEKFIVL